MTSTINGLRISTCALIGLLFAGTAIAEIAKGFIQQAYAEFNQMIDRVINNNGFFEWDDVKTREPKGWEDFRGEAGLLYVAIKQPKTRAKKEQGAS